MFPLIEIFGKTFSIYMLSAALGVLVMLFFSYRAAMRRGLDEVEIIIMELWAFAGAALGSHMLYGFTNFDKMITVFRNIGDIASFSELWDCLVEIFGGAVFYGGLIGAIIVASIYKEKKQLSADYIDIGACAIPLFHTFGRIGCFLGGCCYGKECPVGFIYRYSPVAEANGVTRFPIQLVEAGYNLLLFFILFSLLSKSKLKGKLIAVYLLSYAPARFILEFFRGDTMRGFVFSLSTSQVISILIIVAVISSSIFNKLSKRRS